MSVRPSTAAQNGLIRSVVATSANVMPVNGTPSRT
ncbi:amino acid ABC transporter, permease/ATP-binding, His/Glu/Gln/Arg/opine family domain protein [Burkholderia mallei]|nr:amino acid ABC transporter, permease/ATP-binding, His/Glu/Gln/Arg/opine family domain protein [Burkholderia mallei]